MRHIMSVAQSPPTSISPGATVLEAVQAMARDRVGAVLAVTDGKLEGIFTERDVMMKVVLAELNPATTPVARVMTRDVLTAPPDMTEDDALELMVDRHIRHLPIVDADQRLRGIVSIRNLLQDEVESLRGEVDSLVAYMGADGPGG
ncbi:MAG: CBS domain-containing protein [Candidatus Wallbacteria bacterium]|nr:CBS domain-containing protein [Candidatus Wallbacteria bacterium]